MIVSYEEVMNNLWASKKDRVDRYKTSPKEFLETVLTYVNKLGADGYRFNGIMVNPHIARGAVFLFEKTDVKHKYVYRLDDEVSALVDDCVKHGRIVNDEGINKVYESYGNIHAVTFISQVVGRPIMWIDISEKPIPSQPDVVKRYDDYKLATGKEAIFRGVETKAFQEWLRAQ